MFRIYYYVYTHVPHQKHGKTVAVWILRFFAGKDGFAPVVVNQAYSATSLSSHKPSIQGEHLVYEGTLKGSTLNSKYRQIFFSRKQSK